MNTTAPLEPLVYALLHSLWQGCVAFLFSAAALRLIPARRPQLRYGLCVIALAAVLVSSIATWAILDVSLTARPAPSFQLRSVEEKSSGGSPVGINAPMPSSNSSSGQGSQIGRDWIKWIAGFWVCGVALFLFRMTRDLLGANRLRRDAQEISDPELVSITNDLLSRFGLSRKAGKQKLLVSAQLSVPAVIGVIRPVVLIPACLLTGVPAEYLRAVLAHEFAHIARWDYLVNIGQMVIESLLFFNPFVWGISRQIRREREACCDDVAAACCETRAFYLEALLACAKRASEDEPLSAAALAATGGEKSLVDRAKRLLHSGYRPAIHMKWRTLAGILAMSGLTLGLLIAGAHAAAKILTPQERIDQIEAIQKQFQPAKAKRGNIQLSGQFVTSDGQALPEGDNVQIACESLSENGNTRMEMKGEAKAFPAGKFHTEIERGTIYVGVWTKGYAPALTGALSGNKDVKDVHLVLTKGFNTTVHVVGEDGKPIEGAQIKGFYKGPPQTGQITGTSDAAGDAPIHAAGSGEVDLEVTAEGFRPTHLLSARFSETAVRCVLHKAEPVNGRIVAAETGRPLADAMIRLAGITGPYQEDHDLDTAPILATTNSQGEFTLGSLAPDSIYYFYVEAGERRSVISREPSGGTEPLDIKMVPPIEISGSVIGVQNKSDLEICCSQDIHNGPRRSFGYTTRLTAPVKNGMASFRFSKLYPVRTQIWVDPEKSVDLGELSQSRGDVTIDLNAKPPATATRQVVIRLEGPTDAPIPTGQVTILYEDNVKGWDHPVPLKNGEGRLDVPVPKSITIRQHGLVGYAFPEKEVRVVAGSGAQEIHITVSPAGAVYGTVEGARRSEIQIPTVDVRPTKAFDHSAFNPSAEIAPHDREATSFRFVQTPLALGADYFAIAKFEQSFAVAPPFRLDEKTPIQNLRLIFPEGITVRRRVVDLEGRPIVGLKLDLSYQNPWGTMSDSAVCPRSDSDGWVTIAHVNPDCPGEYRIHFGSRSIYVPGVWPLDLKQHEQEIHIEKGKALSGVVLDAVSGKPVKGLFLSAHMKENPAEAQASRRPYWIRPEEELTDAAGRFRFTNLPDGELILHAMTAGYQNANEPVTAHSGQPEPVILKVKSVPWPTMPSPSPTASAIPKADSGRKADLFEIRGVAKAAGPTTDDYPLQLGTNLIQTLHVEKKALLNLDAIQTVKAGHDAHGYFLDLMLTEEGSRRFTEITAWNIDKRIALLVDGKLRSAPVIREVIRSPRIMVTGNFTEQETDDLAAKMNSAIGARKETATPSAEELPSPQPSVDGSPMGRFQAALQSAVDRKDKAAFVELVNLYDVNSKYSYTSATRRPGLSRWSVTTPSRRPHANKPTCCPMSASAQNVC